MKLEDQDIQEIRSALEGLEAFLHKEFARLQIWLEADQQALTYTYLREMLIPKSGRSPWIIRNCAEFFTRDKPDLMICKNDGTLPENSLFVDFRSVVAIIEMKHAHVLRDDLKKLSKYQSQMKKVHDKRILCWMIYNGHFNEQVHRNNSRHDERRAKAIEEWVRESPGMRGCTIVRLGIPKENASPEEISVRDLFNRHWWDQDKEGKMRYRSKLK